MYKPHVLADYTVTPDSEEHCFLCCTSLVIIGGQVRRRRLRTPVPSKISQSIIKVLWLWFHGYFCWRTL